MSEPTYNRIKDSNSTLHFGMNEVALIIFGKNGKYFMLSTAFNSCFGVVIYSKNAAIAAHIPPRPNLAETNVKAGDDNVVAKMEEVQKLYYKNIELFQPQDVLVLTACFRGSIALPDGQKIIESYLKKMSLDFMTREYDVRPPGMAREDFAGSLFVTGGFASGPAVYFEDRRIAMTIRQSTSSSSSQQEKSSPTHQQLQQVNIQAQVFPSSSRHQPQTVPRSPTHQASIQAKSSSSRHEASQKSRPEFVNTTATTYKGSKGRVIERNPRAFVPDSKWREVLVDDKKMLYNEDLNVYTDAS